MTPNNESINHFAASNAHKMSNANVHRKERKKQQRLEKQIRRVENDDDERQQQTNVACTKMCLLFALLLLIYFVLNTVCFRKYDHSTVKKSGEKELHAAWKTNKSHRKLDFFLFHFTFYFTTTTPLFAIHSSVYDSSITFFRCFVFLLS